jgi:phage tail-like protein
MTNPALETVPNHPFAAFKFAVEIDVLGVSPQVCSAAFAECDGLEITMEVRTIREGGNNTELIRLTGPLGYGQLTLKRGMTANFDLWEWFSAMVRPGGTSLRSSKAAITVLAPDGVTQHARFVLKRCIPIRLKAPALNAREGIVAIEELQLAYESLHLERPT